MAARLGERVTEGQAALSLGVVRAQRGDIPAGLTLVERGYAAAEETNELELLLRASNNFASMLMTDAPDYPRGWKLLRRGIELAQRSGRWARPR